MLLLGLIVVNQEAQFISCHPRLVYGGTEVGDWV